MRYGYAPGSDAAHAAGVAAAPATPAAGGPTVLRPALPYDLATPGTPIGIRSLARAAAAGAHLPPPGGWQHRATFALAVDDSGAEVIASLCLRLIGDLPDRPRRAWVAYVRSEEGGWQSSGAALIDHGDPERPLRMVGVEELKAMLRGEVWAPPERDVPMLQCQGCDRVVRFSMTSWRPYSNHRCDTAVRTEGRS